MSLEEWKPFFERAMQEYVLEQEGGMTEINTRNVMKFMQKTKGYPEIPTEDERRVAQHLSHYFSEFFGPLWDGVKYRNAASASRGSSLRLGTDNLIDFIKYNRVVKAG